MFQSHGGCFGDLEICTVLTENLHCNHGNQLASFLQSHFSVLYIVQVLLLKRRHRHRQVCPLHNRRIKLCHLECFSLRMYVTCVYRWLNGLTTRFGAGAQQIDHIEMVTDMDEDFQLGHQGAVLAGGSTLCRWADDTHYNHFTATGQAFAWGTTFWEGSQKNNTTVTWKCQISKCTALPNPLLGNVQWSTQKGARSWQAHSEESRFLKKEQNSPVW